MTCAEIDAQLATLAAQKTVAEADLIAKNAAKTTTAAAVQAAMLVDMQAAVDVLNAENAISLINADISGYEMLRTMQGC